MNYKTITIKRCDHTGTWKINIEHDPRDRVLRKTEPHWLGFYHYPETIADSKAFKKLKDYLLQRERDALELVQMKIAELEALDLLPQDLPKPTKGKDDAKPPRQRKPKVRADKG